MYEPERMIGFLNSRQFGLVLLGLAIWQLAQEYVSFSGVTLGIIVALAFLPLLWKFRSHFIPPEKIRQHFHKKRDILGDEVYIRMLSKKIAEIKSVIYIRRTEHKTLDPNLIETQKVLEQMLVELT